MQAKKIIKINAENVPFGRLVSKIAIILRGKNKPEFLPYKDVGDFIWVENLSKVKFTGKKLKQKKIYRHSGYIGKLKEIVLEDAFKKNPEKVLKKAVLGMLPKNKLSRKQIKKIKVIS